MGHHAKSYLACSRLRNLCMGITRAQARENMHARYYHTPALTHDSVKVGSSTQGAALARVYPSWWRVRALGLTWPSISRKLSAG